MSEETQIRQIEENIAGLERRIEALRKRHSADTTARISAIESVIHSLKGHLAWHKRRLHEQT